mmetsp:Transcript_172263/g.546934  ORF Transcript_172263/g.546934 Transcript_172263/m.546934 type:complete len:559 (-) Transcript_172263:3-1679(-)
MVGLAACMALHSCTRGAAGADAAVAGFAVLLLALGPVLSVVAGAEWFCNHNMPWEQCEKYLPSERLALEGFMEGLGRAPLPPSGEFQGRGIVMSGGAMHVLQALANLRIIREFHGSSMPVEFWHAFELSETHCAALKTWGAECRSIRLPGVYRQYETVLPAIMLSSFRHILWMDTDITPLLPPERLFETERYKTEGALFWPDHWGAGCEQFGATAWPSHVLWHLLDLPYDRSSASYVAEHEPGHMLVDKERHWLPLCLANYLASRDFFTRVMHGYKDVFRIAWLKMNATNWLSPERPGLLGMSSDADGKFFGPQMLHFWPADDELGSGERGRPLPIYIHQKKKPGRCWNDVLTFPAPLGDCVPFRITQISFSVRHDTMQVWGVSTSHPRLLETLHAVEDLWERGWAQARQTFLDAPSMPLEELVKTLGVEKGPRVSKSDLAQVLSEERQHRFATDPASRRGGFVALGGVWDLAYSNGFHATYEIDEQGQVLVRGNVDGTGFGQLYANSSRGFTHVLYGVHSAGKFEVLRLTPQGTIDSEHWVGTFLCCTAEGRRREER